LIRGKLAVLGVSCWSWLLILKYHLWPRQHRRWLCWYWTSSLDSFTGLKVKIELVPNRKFYEQSSRGLLHLLSELVQKVSSVQEPWLLHLRRELCR